MGNTLGVGEGVGEGLGVGLGDGDVTASVGLGDGETAAGCPHAASNTSATSKTRAITV